MLSASLCFRKHVLTCEVCVSSHRRCDSTHEEQSAQDSHDHLKGLGVSPVDLRLLCCSRTEV